MAKEKTNNLKTDISRLRNLVELDRASEFKIRYNQVKEIDLVYTMMWNLVDKTPLEKIKISEQLKSIAYNTTAHPRLRGIALKAYTYYIGHKGIKVGGNKILATRKEICLPLINDDDLSIRSLAIQNIVHYAYTPADVEDCEDRLVNLKEKLVEAFYYTLQDPSEDLGNTYIPIIYEESMYYVVHYLIDKVKDEVKEAVYAGLESEYADVQHLASDLIKYVYEKE
jgi:hypothetical protein